MDYLFAPNGDRLMDASNVNPLTDEIPPCPGPSGVGDFIVFTTMMSFLLMMILSLSEGSP